VASNERKTVLRTEVLCALLQLVYDPQQASGILATLREALIQSGAHAYPCVTTDGRVRDKSVVTMRRKLARILRDAGWSYPAIGLVMNKDHSGVLYLLKAKSNE